MALSIQEVKSQAKHIRDILCPLVSTSGGTALTRPTFASLVSFFTKLKDLAITIETLRETRVDKALLEICGEDTRWPASLVEKARKRLAVWEKQLGSVGDLGAALWGPGGRMENCRQTSEVYFPDAEQGSQPQATVRQLWVVDGVDSERVKDYGHLNFAIGDWWIKRACAYRDGILEDPNCDIAVGGRGARAIVLACGVETILPDGMSTWRCAINDVKGGPAGPSVHCLIKNMTEHTEVRVLRSCKLQSSLAPKGGLRYDGLYVVVRFGFKTEDVLYYTFTLKRLDDQPGIERALLHPTADEYDDWTEYKRLRAQKKASEGPDNDISLLQAIREMDGTHDGKSDATDDGEWVPETEVIERSRTPNIPNESEGTQDIDMVQSLTNLRPEKEEEQQEQDAEGSGGTEIEKAVSIRTFGCGQGVEHKELNAHETRSDGQERRSFYHEATSNAGSEGSAGGSESSSNQSKMGRDSGYYD